MGVQFGLIGQTMRMLIHPCFFVCAFVMANSSSDADSDPFYSFGGRGSYTGYGTGLIQGYRDASSYDRFGSYGSYGGYNAGGFGGVTASGAVLWPALEGQEGCSIL